MKFWLIPWHFTDAFSTPRAVDVYTSASWMGALGEGQVVTDKIKQAYP